MTKFFYRISVQYPLLIQAAVAGGVGLLLGAAILKLPALLLLMALGGIIFILLIVKRPEIAILGIFFLSATVLDIYSLPTISIGFGNLIIYDLVILVPLGIIILRAFTEQNYRLVNTPLNSFFLGFYMVAILSTLLQMMQKTITLNGSLSEIRIANAYLTFFIVLNLIRDKKHLVRLLNGMLWLATFVAFAMIAQFGLGSAIRILPGRIENIVTAGVYTEGITRILPPGQSLVMVGVVSVIGIIALEHLKPISLVRLAQAFVLGLATLLTFNRNFWVSFSLAILLLLTLIPLPNKTRLFQFILIISLVLCILIPLISSVNVRFGDLIHAALVRFASIFNPGVVNEDSIQYRYIENAYAYQHILEHPFLGTGLGSIYRPLDPRIDFGYTFAYEKRAYIHNSHLWVILKTGLLGYALFIGTFLLFLKRSFEKWSSISDPFLKAIVISFAVTIVGVLASALVSPIFSGTYWAPLLGAMLATNEIIYTLEGQPAQATQDRTDN